MCFPYAPLVVIKTRLAALCEGRLLAWLPMHGPRLFSFTHDSVEMQGSDASTRPFVTHAADRNNHDCNPPPRVGRGLREGALALLCWRMHASIASPKSASKGCIAQNNRGKYGCMHFGMQFVYDNLRMGQQPHHATGIFEVCSGCIPCNGCLVLRLNQPPSIASSIICVFHVSQTLP